MQILDKSAVTLIELLVAIAIATVLFGVTAAMMKSAFDIYAFAQNEAVLDKVVSESLDEITGGGFDAVGIQDALEIITASSDSITFVSLWIDGPHAAVYEQTQVGLVNKIPIRLTRPFKAGASFPIVEVAGPSQADSRLSSWRAVPVQFVPSKDQDPLKADDIVYLNDPVKPGSMIRVIYQPDAMHFKDCRATISKYRDRVIRTYRGREDSIPRHGVGGIPISGLSFKYFDNANNEVKNDSAQIPNITAVDVSVRAYTLEGSKTGNAFINIRNTKTGGAGLLLREGARVRIPASKDIRVFTLANVYGALRDGGKIELEVRPENGPIWKASVDVGMIDDMPAITGYAIEYPSGSQVYSREVSLIYGEPLNFMNLGDNGRYDYDYDKGVANTVNVEGSAELVVTRMDAKGAMLFVRP